MGCQPHQGAGYLDSYDPEINKKYSEFYKVKIPIGKGLKIPEMYDASINGKLKVLWLMGEDNVQTDPNTQHVMKAMSNLDLLVVQEIFMTETSKMAHVILPASSFLEKSGTFTNGERRIQKVQAVVEPIEGTKPDGQIIVEIMNRMGYKQPAYDPKTLLEEISQIVPFFAGVKWDELGDNGKQWPVLPDGSDTEILHTDTFKRGKGKFQVATWKESSETITHGK
jgi:formate dehydrogenase major subunit